MINFIFIGSPTATHALIEAGYNKLTLGKMIKMILSIEILLLVLVVLLALISFGSGFSKCCGSFGAYSFLTMIQFGRYGSSGCCFRSSCGCWGITVFFIAVLFNTAKQIVNPLDLSVKIISGILCGVFGYLLLLGVSDLPTWGDANAPVNAGVASYYVKEAYHDTKVQI